MLLNICPFLFLVLLFHGVFSGLMGGGGDEGRGRGILFVEGLLPDLPPPLSPSVTSAAWLARSHPPQGLEAAGPQLHLGEGDGELKAFPVEPVDTLG